MHVQPLKSLARFIWPPVTNKANLEVNVKGPAYQLQAKFSDVKKIVVTVTDKNNLATAVTFPMEAVSQNVTARFYELPAGAASVKADALGNGDVLLGTVTQSVTVVAKQTVTANLVLALTSDTGSLVTNVNIQDSSPRGER